LARDNFFLGSPSQVGDLLIAPFGMASVQLATALLDSPQGPQGIYGSRSGAFYDFFEIDKAVRRFESWLAFPDMEDSTYETRTCARGGATP